MREIVWYDEAPEASENMFDTVLSYSAWQAIETAPTDGREILVCVASSPAMPRYVAYWVAGHGWVTFGGDAQIITCEPTHWRALPAVPDHL